ncbi:MAG: ArsR family transcriptional regulator [Candidatus Woesearchaeota archaeon]
MASKRTFHEIRDIILYNLANGKKTAHQISTETGIGWKTVNNHLTYLIGIGMIKVIFSNNHMKVVELSEQGRAYIEAKGGQPK